MSLEEFPKKDYSEIRDARDTADDRRVKERTSYTGEMTLYQGKNTDTLLLIDTTTGGTNALRSAEMFSGFCC
jgi:hypothetical protein